MIKYRPNRGSLDDAMKETKDFLTLEEMYGYIVSSWMELGLGQLFSESDLCVSDSLGADERVGWKDYRYVLTTRIGDKIYTTPQCIAMCSVE